MLEPLAAVANPSGPAARYGHSAVVMGVPGGVAANAYRMLVYAGRGTISLLSDVWSYDMIGEGGWSAVAVSNATASPSARYLHTATALVSEATGLSTMLVFGESDELSVLSDLWKLTQSTSATSAEWSTFTAPRGTWLDCRSRLPPVSIFGIECTSQQSSVFPARYLHQAVAVDTTLGGGKGLLVFGGVGVDRVTSGSNWDAYGNFGGGVRPDLFVICIDGDTADCNHPRILGRAVGRRELSSTVLLLSALAASFLALH